MSNRTILNLALLVIVTVLILIVVYEPGVEDQSSPILAAIDKTTVTQIDIERTGQRPVKLKNISGNWTMQSPFQISANKIKTESLLTLFEQKTFAQYPMQDLDAKKYGLDIPRASITFNDKLRFDFGATEPLNKRRYVRHNETLYVINDHFYYQLMSPVTVFVNHKLLPVSDNISKLVLPDFSLTMQDGSWQLEPKSDDISNEQANELIENWKLSHAMHISEYEGKANKPTAKVYLDGNETPLEFHIIQTDAKFYLARPDLGIKYQIADDKTNSLLKFPAKLEMPTNNQTDPSSNN